MARVTRPDVDPERREPKNPFDHAEGLTGQSYSRGREEVMRQADPSGALNALPADFGDGAGARQTVDPQTGEALGTVSIWLRNYPAAPSPSAVLA